MQESIRNYCELRDVGNLVAIGDRVSAKVDSYARNLRSFEKFLREGESSLAQLLINSQKEANKVMSKFGLRLKELVAVAQQFL